MFLHEAWLKNEQRAEGYFQFIDWLLTLDDVFVVRVRDVIEWLQHPTTVEEYGLKTHCKAKLRAADIGTQPMQPPTRVSTRCSHGRAKHGRLCEYKSVPQLNGETRYMTICGNKRCPANYPWVDAALAGRPF